MRTLRLTTEKLIHGGQALARTDSKVCFVWNALAGEEVEARVLQEKSGFIEAQALEILKPSPDRIPSRESHFLACSPWQILSWEAENRWKTEIAAETYARVGKLKEIPLSAIQFQPDGDWGYRNKIEYSFLIRKAEGRQAEPCFGIHQRGTQDILPVEACLLASPEVQHAAEETLDWIKTTRIPFKALKRLSVKTNGTGQSLAALYITARCPLPGGLPPDLGIRHGVSVYLETGTKKSSSPQTPLWQAGQTTLPVTLRQTQLETGPQSFFQVNLPVFEMALQDIAEHLSPEDKVIDYYAGVGAISLPLAPHFQSAVLVESHPESAFFAQKNITALGLTHCRLERMRAEKAGGLIQPDHTVIFDPPRAGLGDTLIQTILAQKPRRLLYLSCEIATQARDLAKLTTGYTLKKILPYNFFPRTPHIEALAVLDRAS